MYAYEAMLMILLLCLFLGAVFQFYKLSNSRSNGPQLLGDADAANDATRQDRLSRAQDVGQVPYQQITRPAPVTMNQQTVHPAQTSTTTGTRATAMPNVTPVQAQGTGQLQRVQHNKLPPNIQANTISSGQTHQSAFKQVTPIAAQSTGQPPSTRPAPFPTNTPATAQPNKTPVQTLPTRETNSRTQATGQPPYQQSTSTATPIRTPVPAQVTGQTLVTVPKISPAPTTAQPNRTPPATAQPNRIPVQVTSQPFPTSTPAKAQPNRTPVQVTSQPVPTSTPATAQPNRTPVQVTSQQVPTSTPATAQPNRIPVQVTSQPVPTSTPAQHNTVEIPVQVTSQPVPTSTPATAQPNRIPVQVISQPPYQQSASTSTVATAQPNRTPVQVTSQPPYQPSASTVTVPTPATLQDTTKLSSSPLVDVREQYKGRITATVTGPSVFGSNKARSLAAATTTTTTSTTTTANTQSISKPDMNQTPHELRKRDTTTSVADNRKDRSVSISDLTSEEKVKIDEKIRDCVVYINKVCLAGTLKRINTLAPPSVVNDGKVPDHPYMVIDFDDSKDKSLSDADKRVRKSFKIHSDDTDNSRLCRLARFKLSSSLKSDKYYPYAFYDYTPYVEESAPHFNVYTSTIDANVQCQWQRCYCETKLKDITITDLKYALVLAPAA